MENLIQGIVSKAVQRGRVTVSFKIVDKPHPKLVFNKDLVKQYLSYARTLHKEFRLENDLRMGDLIKLPGVVEAHDVLVSAEKTWPALEKGLLKALASMERMRAREGKSLAADISGVLKRMTSRIKEIRAREKAVLAEKKKALSDDEFLVFQKGIDIHEEIARLEHYIAECARLLAANASVGKKMDFVAQEMQREVNTMGSKFQDQVVSNCVIALKSKIEKLREQAQNVE